MIPGMTLDEAVNTIKEFWGRDYVYVLRKPDGEPFYVGVGRKGRISAHERYARSPKGLRGPKHSMIRSIIASGLAVDYSVTFCETRSEAKAEECRLIQLYGRRDLQTGTLMNFTGGGDGRGDYVCLPETRAKLSASLKGRQHSPEARAKLAAAAKAKWSDPVWRAKTSAAMKNAAKRPERLVQISLANKGNKHSDEAKEKIRSGNKKWKRSDELCAKYSAVAKEIWADPVRRAPIVEGGKRFRQKKDLAV